jgi:hypothetical protein
MQINNWSDLLKSKRVSKTPRDLDNDLVIIGTYTGAGLKKQDPWQPYAMTLNDLAAAIGGGGGGGVSFQLLADEFIEIYENGSIKTAAFTPAENSIIKIKAESIPNGLRWRGEFTTGLPSNPAGNYDINDVVYMIDASGRYKTYFAKQSQNVPGAQAPSTTSYSNTYWAQLGDNSYRFAILTLYKWVNSGTAPSTNLPLGNAVYNWVTKIWDVSGVTLNDWSTTIPAPTAGWYLYKIDTVLANNDSSGTDTIPVGSTVSYLSYAGADAGAIVTAFTTKSADYSIAAGDRGTVIDVDTTNSNSIITITPGTPPGFATGGQVIINWRSASNSAVDKVIINATNVTSANNMNRLRTPGSMATLIYRGGGNWLLAGDLIPELA